MDIPWDNRGPRVQRRGNAASPFASQSGITHTKMTQEARRRQAVEDERLPSEPRRPIVALADLAVGRFVICHFRLTDSNLVFDVRRRPKREGRDIRGDPGVGYGRPRRPRGPRLGRPRGTRRWLSSSRGRGAAGRARREGEGEGLGLGVVMVVTMARAPAWPRSPGLDVNVVARGHGSLALVVVLAAVAGED